MQDNKPEKYYIDYVKEIYRLYSSGMTYLDANGVRSGRAAKRSVKELRDYGRGEIDVRKFQNRLDPMITKGKNKGKRRWNISWDPLRVYSKIRNIMKSKITGLILVPQTHAIDEDARVEKLMSKNRAKLLMNESMKMFMEGSGYVPQSTQDMVGVDSKEEVDMLYEMGGIRLAAEIKMKDAIDKLIENSSWRTIRSMIVEDIIDLNGFAVDQVTENGREVLKYVDLSRVIIRPSIHADFNDTDFRGYIKHMRIQEIIDLDPTVDSEAIKRASGVQTSPTHSGGVQGAGYGHREDYARGGQGKDINQSEFGYKVMKLYWVDEEVRRYVTGVRKGGVRQFEEVGPEFELSKRGQKAGKAIEEIPLHKLYQCYWVVGTDIIFNYGEVDTIVKDGQPGSKSVMWPMTVFMDDEMSVTEKCISFDDDLQTNLYKMRHLVAKLPPGPRMIIFQSMVSDTVQLGDETYSVLDMYANFQREGLMILNDAESYQMPGEDNTYGKSPVMPVPIDVMNDYNMFRQGMFDSVENMRQTTGINEYIDGTTNKPDTLKHVAMNQVEASNNSIKPYVDLYTEGFSYICKFGAKKFQLLTLNGDVDLGVASTLDQYYRDVVLTKEVWKHDWNISITVYSDDTRSMLLADLAERKQELPAAVYFSIWNMVMDGDFKKAQWRLSVETKKAADIAHKRQMEIAQATASGNAQAVIAGEQAKAATIQAQMQARMAEIKAETDEEIRKEKELLKLRKEFEQFKNELDTTKQLKLVRENNQNRLNQ